MINAREFYSDNDGQTLRFKFTGWSKASLITITLNGLDLYDIKFIKPGRLNKKTWTVSENKTVAEFDNVYAEDMKQLIESTTGLYLSL